MLPELDGIFSGLIRLVFQKAVSPDTGDYSDAELRSLVTQVNRIYEHFRSSKGEGQATKAALAEFVMEINRRYGVIKAKDMKDYWNMVNLARTGQAQGLANDTNFAILPDEDAAETDRRAPSDRYGVGPYARYDPATGRPINAATGDPYDPFANRTTLDTTGTAAKQMLRQFRTLLDQQFADGRAAFGKISYALLIQQAEGEIRRATSSDTKLKVAFRLIQGTSVVGTDADKAFMFHETVVVGLNLLSSIEAMLRNYSTSLDAMNPVTIENAIMDAIYMSAKGVTRDAQGAETALAGVAVPPNMAALRTLVAARHQAYAAPAGGAGATVFDRYLATTATFAGRSGIPLDVTLADVFAFLGSEYAAYMALAGVAVIGLGGTALPSQFAQDATLTLPNGGTAVSVATTALVGLGPGAAAAGAEGVSRFIRALRMCARIFVDYGRVMQDYVENVFDLSTSSQGLVEARFTSGTQPGLQLGFTKLRGLAESILVDVKFFLEQFRPFLTKETIARFELRANAGSVYWIEDHLVDEIFRGRTDASPKSLDGISRRANAILQGMVRETTVQLDALSHAGLINAGQAVRLTMIPIPAANNDSRYEWYGQAFSGILFYNTTFPDYGAAAVTSNTEIPIPVMGWDQANAYSLGSSILTARPAPPNLQPVFPLAGPANNIQTGRYQVYRSDANMTPYRSLLFAFNQLVSRYMSSLTDVAGGRRIYVNLINSFANGTVSQAVSVPVGNTFPDIAAAGVEFGARGDPKPTAIICQSLAWLLQRFIKDVNPSNQVPDHLVSTLTDVPLYMKEAYRANLPSFVKLFDLISQKGDFIKQMLQKVPIRLDRPSQQAGAVAAVTVLGGANVADVPTSMVLGIAGGVAQLWSGQPNNEYPQGALGGLEVFSGRYNSDQMRARLTAIIDAISGGAYTLSTAASEVLKELGDAPAYFQTQEGSIETYKMRYGMMPLMPLSLSLWFLSDVQLLGAGFAGGIPAGAAAYNDQVLFPAQTFGAPNFKMLYGHRQLLARATPVGYDQVPGVRTLLAAYNGVSAKREQLDEGRYLGFVQNAVAALRYVVDARNYKPMIATTGALFSTVTLIGSRNGSQNGITNYTAGTQAAGNVAGAFPGGTAVFALAGGVVAGAAVPAVDVQAVLAIVENSNQDEEGRKISDRVGGTLAGMARSRDLERIYNLIDMNIIPINVHALMRDIPLANLYNYEFTFEQMVASLYGEQTATYTGAGPTDDETRTTRQMLLRLLVDPYVPVSAAMYGSDALNLGSAGYVSRIFRGDNDTGMGRPKFLSDQLFNKALFGSVYQAQSDYDEGGPSVGIGAARGRGAFIGPVVAAMQGLRALFVETSALAQTFAPRLNAGYNAAIVAAGATANEFRSEIYDAFFGPAGASSTGVRDWENRALQMRAALPANAGGADITAAIDGVFTAAGANSIVAPFNAIVALGANKAARIGNAAFDASAAQLVDRMLSTGVGNSVARRALDSTAFINNNIREAIRLETVRAPGQALPGATGTTAVPNWGPQVGRRAGTISYLRAPEANTAAESAVVSVSIGAVPKAQLQDIGRARFDTTFVRNIFFIANVVRIVRLKINRELTQSRNVLVASHSAIAAGVTEYGSDPFGPNESYGSTLPDGQARFNDRDTF